MTRDLEKRSSGRLNLELIPSLRIGWLNGWTLVVLLYLLFGIFLMTLPPI
jgi:hypothetical protein